MKLLGNINEKAIVAVEEDGLSKEDKSASLSGNSILCVVL